MANNILTREDCAKVEEVALKIAAYEGLIENCVQSFSYCINNQDVSAWVNGTTAGKETLEKVNHNNNGLLELGKCIEMVYQVSMSLVHQSEQINGNNSGN